MSTGRLIRLAAFGLFLAAHDASASNFDGDSWCGGPVRIALDVSGAGATGAAPAELDQAVFDAAARWNGVLGVPLFQVIAGTPAQLSGDGINAIYFSTNISPTQAFGTQFGYTQARRGPDGLLGEADIILNPAHRWFYYHGLLRYESNGDRIPDLYRIALHELGHLLGLNHPGSDSEFTIMRSRMSDIDDLTPEDLGDAKKIVARMFAQNAPAISSPGRNHSTIHRCEFLLRGSGRPFFIPTMTLRIDSAARTRQLHVRIGQSWSRQLHLDEGRNRIRFYYRRPDGWRVRFATKVIRARLAGEIRPSGRSSS